MKKKLVPSVHFSYICVEIKEYTSSNKHAPDLGLNDKTLFQMIQMM